MPRLGIFQKLTSHVVQVSRFVRDLWNSIEDKWQNEERKWEDIV